MDGDDRRRPRKILEALAMRHPQVSTRQRTLTREEVAKAVGMSPSGGGFANYLGKLRGLGLIDYQGAGIVRASDELFPTGALR